MTIVPVDLSSMTREISELITALLLVILVSSLVEYIVHRLMHARIVLGQKHLEHHKEGTGQGWFEIRWY